MLQNLIKYRDAVGDRIECLFVSGTDFGTQNHTFISRQMFRELFKPYYRRVNDWIHSNTPWKTFYHSCGAVYDFIPEFIDMEYGCGSVLGAIDRVWAQDGAPACSTIGGGEPVGICGSGVIDAVATLMMCKRPVCTCAAAAADTLRDTSASFSPFINNTGIIRLDNDPV